MVTSNARVPLRLAAWRCASTSPPTFRALVTTFSAPQTPHPGEYYPCASICLMDKCISGVDMWARLCLVHIPTPAKYLSTGGRPSGLTRFACPIF